MNGRDVKLGIMIGCFLAWKQVQLCAVRESAVESLERILYVDDDPETRELVSLGLNQISGLSLMACDSGYQALAMIEDFNPQLILLDAMMPDMDGPATLQKIRQLDSFKHTPVLFITAIGQPDEVKPFIELGALDVIAKPFDPTTLADRLLQIWGEKQSSSVVTDASVQASMQALTTAYARKLPEKTAAIKDGWQKLKGNPADQVAFQQLDGLLHTLAGTAATFRFDVIGGLAGDMRGQLHGHTDTNDHMVTERLDGLLARLLAMAGDPVSIDYPSLDQITPKENEPSDEMKGYGVPESGEPCPLIYMVDDDVDLLLSMQLQIEAFGYRVEIFTDLKAFDTAVAKQLPLAVLMDVLLAGGKQSGIEHINQLNQRLSRPLTTIFVSALDDMNTRLAAVRAHGLAYLHKPVLAEQVSDAIDAVGQHQDESVYRVLIVDDVVEQGQFIELILQQAGMETEVVNRPLEVLESLSEFAPDLILMDLYMPDCNGMELASVIRQIERYLTIPIVFLSFERDLNVQMQAMDLGADGFLCKPIQPEHLLSAVLSRVRRGRVIRKLEATDRLTGLLNHGRSEERLEQELARAKREHLTFTYAILDLDHFKRVNDSYGHAAGDRVLKSLANMLRQRLREYDVVGRYGGEEFVLILPNTGAGVATEMIEDMRRNFAAIPHVSGTGSFCCSFSCGLAAYPAFDQVDGLQEAADRALYQAKEAGRNRIVAATG